MISYEQSSVLFEMCDNRSPGNSIGGMDHHVIVELAGARAVQWTITQLLASSRITRPK